MQVQQEIIGAGLPARGMLEMLAKAGPLVDFKQQIGESHMGNPPTDLLGQHFGALRQIRAFIHGHNQFPILHPDTIWAI
jgi:hypothetical protein